MSQLIALRSALLTGHAPHWRASRPDEVRAARLLGVNSVTPDESRVWAALASWPPPGGSERQLLVKVHVCLSSGDAPFFAKSLKLPLVTSTTSLVRAVIASGARGGLLPDDFSSAPLALVVTGRSEAVPIVNTLQLVDLRLVRRAVAASREPVEFTLVRADASLPSTTLTEEEFEAQFKRHDTTLQVWGDAPLIETQTEAAFAASFSPGNFAVVVFTQQFYFIECGAM